MMTGPALDLGPVRRPRRPSLTPLIDVVFLLLVFFMLVAHSGAETVLPLHAGNAGGTTWEGPPRVINLTPDGPRLNGTPVSPDRLGSELAPLMPRPDAPIVLRTGEADAQALADVLDRLRAAGFARVIVLD